MEQREATLHQDIQSFDVNIVLDQLEFLGRPREAINSRGEILISRSTGNYKSCNITWMARRKTSRAFRYTDKHPEALIF
jgi:hypothetical protein